MISKTIAISAIEDMCQKPWDNQSINQGITGSEEAIIYMAEELVKLGYRVIIFGNPPLGSPSSAPQVNPRYVHVSYDDGTLYDIGIVWRYPYKVDFFIGRAEKVYYWPHDTSRIPIKKDVIDRYEDVLWLSKWQRNDWIEHNPGFAKFTKVFGNGINPASFMPIQERRHPHSCIYASNYARGLKILLDLWPQVKTLFPQATLDIYYGWQPWSFNVKEKDMESEMKQQVEDLKMLGVNEHGQVGHKELNQAFNKASFWTYPCIKPETFCITALKAQYAGAIPVIIEGSALPETVRYGYKCQESSRYLEILIIALLNAENVSLKERESMRGFIEQEFTWKVIAEKWHKLFIYLS